MRCLIGPRQIHATVATNIIYASSIFAQEYYFMCVYPINFLAPFIAPWKDVFNHFFHQSNFTTQIALFFQKFEIIFYFYFVQFSILQNYSNLFSSFSSNKWPCYFHSIINIKNEPKKLTKNILFWFLYWQIYFSSEQVKSFSKLLVVTFSSFFSFRRWIFQTTKNCVSCRKKIE